MNNKKSRGGHVRWRQKKKVDEQIIKKLKMKKEQPISGKEIDKDSPVAWISFPKNVSQRVIHTPVQKKTPDGTCPRCGCREFISCDPLYNQKDGPKAQVEKCKKCGCTINRDVVN